MPCRLTIPRVFLAISGLLYVVSMFLPIDTGSDDSWGWTAAYACFAITAEILWRLITMQAADDWGIGLMLFGSGVFANLGYLAAMALGWKLRFRPSLLAILLFGTFLVALTIPPLFHLFPIFGAKPGWAGLSALPLWDTYSAWNIGYWVWTGSFLVAALTWTGIRWRHKLARFVPDVD